MLPSVCISTPPFYYHRYSLAVLMSSVQQMSHPVKSLVSPAATTLKLRYTSRNSMKAERTSEVSITRYYVLEFIGSASDHRPSTVHSELHVNFFSVPHDVWCPSLELSSLASSPTMVPDWVLQSVRVFSSFSLTSSVIQIEST